MSKVYSFRLNNNNPREAKVIELLNTELGSGHNIRQIIVEAILMLDETCSTSISSQTLNELQIVSAQVNCLIEIINGLNHSRISEHENTENRKLTTNFIDSVSKSFHPGIKIENTET